MKGDYFHLERLSEINNLSVRINNKFLEKLLRKASKSEKPHCDPDLIKKLDMKPTSRNVCCTIYGWTKYNKSVPFEKIRRLIEISGSKWSDAEEKLISIKSRISRSEVKLKLPLELDKQMGSVIGHILGDGSIDKKYQQVFFSNSEKELLKEFSTNMKSIFSIEPRIWMQKAPEFGNTQWDRRLNSIEELTAGRNGALFYPTICGLILNKIFNDFSIGKDKKITKGILNSNKEFKRGLIRAFYDDESTVGQKNIRLFQDRKDMLEIFRNILNEFEISSSQIKTYMKHDKERYYFDIFRKSNFAKFEKEIGFTSPEKNKRLKKLLIIKNYKNSK